MPVRVITPPSPIVTLADVEPHLNEIPIEDKTYVEALIAAATAWIDGPMGWLGRALGVQELECVIDHPCSSRIELPCRPVIEIVGAWVGVEAVETSAFQPGDLTFDFGVARSGPVKVRYWAGYGKRDAADPDKWVNDAPAQIKVAIMMLVAQWYSVRENVVLGDAPRVMPFAVDALLTPYRVFRV